MATSAATSSLLLQLPVIGAGAAGLSPQTMRPTPPLPMSRAEMAARGWDEVDIVFVTGDAYVDHPSFAMALLGRLLEAQGFRVAILSQPDWHSCDAWRTFGRPRLFFAVSAGNMDSMINHYTANKQGSQRRRLQPWRPDRPATRSGHAGLLPALARGLQGRAGDRRRRRSQPAPPALITTIGATRSGGRSCSIARPTCSSTAWASGHRRNRPPAGSRARRVRDLRDMRGVAYRLGASETPPREGSRSSSADCSEASVDATSGRSPR